MSCAEGCSAMIVEQLCWTTAEGWMVVRGDGRAEADLVLVFGATHALADETAIAAVRDRYPGAIIVGCSSAGEILDTRVLDETLVATAIAFEATSIRTAVASINAHTSEATGRRLAEQLDDPALAHVFVLSEGLNVNGSNLVRGLTAALPSHVVVTGGLAGDGDRFVTTNVLAEGEARGGVVTAVGLYGDRIRVGHGSFGGWDPFGPDRLITRSEGNVLYELDGEPALDLYKRYLGDYAADLPHSGLLFPLSLVADGSDTGLVRTILAVDEQAHSLTFAGDVPQGMYCRLMKANFSRLIDGATEAAAGCAASLRNATPQVAILISCVGRKLILKQRVEEEVESVRAVLGPAVALAGFYSYGEISPFTPSARCELHNQTMTVTTWTEV